MPSSLKDVKSPLEANLEAITAEVKELKEKALNFHLDKEKPKEKVTRPCHTNRIKINNKITTSAPQAQNNSKPKEEAKESASVPKKQDWFDWIEEKKSLTLTEKEKDQVDIKAQEILESRQKRFKGLPDSFLRSYVQEIALAWVLSTNRTISYLGEDCLLSKELGL